jgi:hypothetical protein
MQAAGMTVAQRDEEDEAARAAAQAQRAAALAEAGNRTNDERGRRSADRIGCAEGRIPVLDIGAFLTASQRRRHWPRRCPEPAKTRALVVANHGVPQAARSVSRLRHSSSPAGSRQAGPQSGDLNIGYLPFGGQTVRHSPVNKNTKFNFSESF